MPNGDVVESFFELLDNALKKSEFLKKICQMTESITAHCNLTEESIFHMYRNVKKDEDICQMSDFIN